MEKKLTKPHTVSAKVSDTVKKKLEAIAKRRERKVSYVISKILEDYVR